MRIEYIYSIFIFYIKQYIIIFSEINLFLIEKMFQKPPYHYYETVKK